MTKIALVGGNKAFLEFLKKTGAEFVVYDNAEDAIKSQEVQALILLPEYEKGEEVVEQLSLDCTEILAERKRKGFKVYSENYNSYNTYNLSIFGYETLGKICHISSEALCAVGGLQYAMDGERILQASGAGFLPSIVKFTDPYALDDRILLMKGNYVGTTQIATSAAENAAPVLVKSGSIYSAMISITNVDSVNFRPNCRWKKLYSHIFSDVLGVEKEKVQRAFEDCFKPLQTRFKLNSNIEEKDREKIISQSVCEAVKWHFDSGIVLGEDGKDGSVEMIMSSNGQRLYSNKRVDAGMYTGWFLYAAGKNFSDSRWITCGKNIFDFFAVNAQLSGGVQDGLYTWYYNKNAGPHYTYSIDCGRDGIALCNMYRLTGDTEILKRIRRLAEGFSNWMNGDLLRSNSAEHENPPADSVRYPNTKVRTPAVYAEMVSFMIMAAKLTGERRYLDVVLPLADRLVEEYPKYEYYGHTTSSRNARFLLLLLCVQVTGERDYSDMINLLIDYISSIQLPCGGIYSEDNITFENNIKNNNENGITSPWDNDRISDQLYCVNNSLAALSVLKCISDDSRINKEKGLNTYKALLEYIVKIQIVSGDERFNGGWMRAYSMTHEEYYGLDLDKFWGPYCIMAGWIMGILPLTLLSELTGECPYVVKD